MVPHRGILRIIALVAHFSGSPASTRDELCAKFKVKFPSSKYTYFWQSEILLKLPPEVETKLRTYQPSLDGTEALFAAAKALDISKYVVMTAEGPEVKIDADIVKWRQHDSMRLAFETMLLCGISAAQVADDMFKMYGVTYDSDLVTVFKQLFMDTDYADGSYWTNYAECISIDELLFKSRLRGEPKDFVRWKLGVPVTLETDMVLSRLVSDAYYTERVIKSERRDPSNPHALPSLDRDDLARVKMERDTIFKSIDRMVKLREQSGASGNSDARAELERIITSCEGCSADYPTLEDLNKDG